MQLEINADEKTFEHPAFKRSDSLTYNLRRIVSGLLNLRKRGIYVSGIYKIKDNFEIQIQEKTFLIPCNYYDVLKISVVLHCLSEYSAFEDLPTEETTIKNEIKKESFLEKLMKMFKHIFKRMKEDEENSLVTVFSTKSAEEILEERKSENYAHVKTENASEKDILDSCDYTKVKKIIAYN